DHIGAEVGQHLAREGAERAGEIEHPVGRQRAADGGHGARRARKAAMARPISCGESSWMKWLPLTVTSSWRGQVRQNSRWGPVRMEPGSALTKSLGSGLFERKRPYWLTTSTTSGGSPSMGICRGQVSVGRRDSPGSRYGLR